MSRKHRQKHVSQKRDKALPKIREGRAQKPLVQKLANILGASLLGILVSGAIYFHFAEPPFQAVPSQSMIPALKVGDLVLVKPIAVSNVKRGDIIVVQLPKQIQQLYHYPASIVHRVVKVNRSGSHITFRTKGDNNPGQDPYTVNPNEVRGIVTHVVPKVGFIILFMHSRQALIFILLVVLLYAFYRGSAYAEKKQFSLKKTISSYVNAEVIEQLSKLEQTQHTSMQHVDESLSTFAVAMNEYATHLRSHTAAVQDMAASAAALRSSAQEQVSFFHDIRHVIGLPGESDDVRVRPAESGVVADTVEMVEPEKKAEPLALTRVLQEQRFLQENQLVQAWISIDPIGHDLAPHPAPPSPKRIAPHVHISEEISYEQMLESLSQITEGLRQSTEAGPPSYKRKRFP